MDTQTAIIIAAAAGTTMLVVILAISMWLWLRSRRRKRDWIEAWELLSSNPQRALRLLEQFTPKKIPNNPAKRDQYFHARFGQAVCLVRLHRLDEAENALHEAAPYAPLPNELEQLCQAWLTGSQETVRLSAVESYARLLALPAETHSPDGRAKAEEAILKQLQSQAEDTHDRLEQRLGLATRVLELSPRSVVAQREQGFLYGRLQRWQEAVAALDAALALQPNQLDIYRALAQALRQVGDHTRLAETLLAIHRLAPDATTAFEAGLACFELTKLQQHADVTQPGAELTDHLAQSIALFEQATQLDTNHARAWLALSRAQWRAGQREAAVASIEKALALDATIAEGFALLGEYQLTLGNLAGARETLGRAFQLDQLSPDVLRQLGDLEFAEGNYAAALEHYKQLAVPENDTALEDNLARAYLETGRADAAFEILGGRQVLSPEARLVLARAQARLGRWPDALKTFEAVRLPQSSLDWDYYYAAALAANGRYKEAEAIFTRLLVQPEWKDRARRQLGHLKLSQGDHAKAGELYQGQNGDTSFAFDLGRVALLTGDADTARRHFRESGGSQSAARFGLAYADAELGSLDSLQSLSADYEFAADALEIIADRAFEARRYADAMPSYEQVIARRSSVSSRILERLASGYVHLRRDKDALPHLVELVKRKPDDIALRTNLALCRYRLGRLAFSKSQWEAARREFAQAHELVKGHQKEAADALLAWALEAAYREVLRILEKGASQPAQIKKAKELCQFGCQHGPRDLRWHFAAGIVNVLGGDFASSVKHFLAARQLSPKNTHVLLGLALSQHEARQPKEAQATLAELLSVLDAAGPAASEALRVTSRFAQSMSAAAEQNWAAAAEPLLPLLSHPLVTSSKKLTPRDVAQVALAYFAAAGNKEKAGDLAKTYLPDMKGLSDVLIGLVQAEAKDYAGAVVTLGRAYSADRNAKVLRVLVGCVLAVAAQAVLKGDLKTATDSVGQALRYDPNNKAAKSLQDALSFASSLKSLNLAQLDEAITTCQQQFTTDKSPELVRSLANLYHRKAVQAEKRPQGSDDAWKTCVQFWASQILQNQQFWPRFVESYNTGRGRREQIKEDEITELRTAIPGQMVEVHSNYAKHYRQNRSENGLVRHINLLWQWDGSFKPSDDFIIAIVNFRELDDWQAEMLERAADKFTSRDLREQIRKRLGIYWYNTGIALVNEIIEDMKAGNIWRVQEKGKRAKTILGRACNLDPSDTDFRDWYNLAKEKF